MTMGFLHGRYSFHRLADQELLKDMWMAGEREKCMIVAGEP